MRKNARRASALAIERKALAPLPRFRTSDYSVATVTVTRSGTISVRNVLYTVPSRLVGCRLKVHIYDDRLVCHLGLTPVLTVPRRYFKRGGPGVRVGRLPPSDPCPREEAAGLPALGVPRGSVPRDRLPAGLGAFLMRRLDPRQACRVYVGLLHLAATQACEAQLADHLESLLAAGGSRISTGPGPSWPGR